MAVRGELVPSGRTPYAVKVLRGGRPRAAKSSASMPSVARMVTVAVPADPRTCAAVVWILAQALMGEPSASVPAWRGVRDIRECHRILADVEGLDHRVGRGVDHVDGVRFL